jgi:PAS domain S-box-containing protein
LGKQHARFWRSLSLRLSAAFITLLITAALAVGYLFDQGRADVLEQRYRDHLRRHAEGVAGEIQRFVNGLQRDVLFLARTPPIQGIRRALDGGGTDSPGNSSLQQWQERLQQIFLAFAEAKPEYFQIRLIGTRDGGRELVRIERTGHELSATASAALQAKGDRYYYQETAGLPDGGIYLSRIDLNREHGRISAPHRPTLRAATPIRDPDGDLFGVLVINMDMGYTFRRAQSFHDAHHQVFIANEHGDFLLHPEPGRAFAAALGRPFRLEDAFAEKAAAIGELMDSGDPGRFFDMHTGADARIAYVTARRWDPGNPERRLLVMVVDDAIALQQTLGLMLRESLLGMGGLLLLAVAMVLLTVRRATRSVTALATAADAIADGDHDVELPKTDSSEVGRLIRAFRHMVAEVERRQHALTRLNLELEQRVQDRTAELSRQHDLQRLILESIADGVVVTDAEGRFILWNQKAEQIVGAGPEPVPPEDWPAHFGVFSDETGALLPMEELPLVRALRGERTDMAELYLQHPSRTEGRWTQVTARPLQDDEGDVAGAVAVLVDVTEQKRLRTALQRHRTELVNVGRLMLGAEVAAAAADQLSQPIAAICNYAGAAARLQAQGRLDPRELHAMLAQIEHTAGHAGKILDRLRARIKRREPLPVAFDLNQVVASALNFHQERISRQSVKVERELAPDLPRLVGDPLELEHALIQVVANALDAMEPTAPGQRRLSVRTARLAEHGMVAVDIADTGSGVDPRLAEQVFEAWVTDKPGALGIGLTIAKTIVEGIGGQVSLNPSKTTGAELRVQLPVHGGMQR